MPTITLKNIPEELFRDLKATAKANERSINSEVLHAIKIHIIRNANAPSPEEVVKKAREIRERISGTLSPEEIESAISNGRP